MINGELNEDKRLVNNICYGLPIMFSFVASPLEIKTNSEIQYENVLLVSGILILYV